MPGMVGIITVCMTCITRPGFPLSRQRVTSPFISQAVSTLHLYKVIDPDTWGRMVSQVNGVSFAGMYGEHGCDGLALHQLSGRVHVERVHVLPP